MTSEQPLVKLDDRSIAPSDRPHSSRYCRCGNAVKASSQPADLQRSAGIYFCGEWKNLSLQEQYTF